jgi:hypothetical protein
VAPPSVSIDSLFGQVAVLPEDVWEGARFGAWRQIKSPVAKGTLGERIAALWYEREGHNVAPAPQHERTYDLIVDNMEVEVKTSAINEDKKFWWNQIRPHGADAYVLLGIMPWTVFGWRTTLDALFDAGKQSHGGTDLIAVTGTMAEICAKLGPPTNLAKELA